MRNTFRILFTCKSDSSLMSWVTEKPQHFFCCKNISQEWSSSVPPEGFIQNLGMLRKKSSTISEFWWASDYNSLFQKPFTFETRSFLFEYKCTNFTSACQNWICLLQKDLKQTCWSFWGGGGEALTNVSQSGRELNLAN
jgi:hypothetical protein